MPHQTLIDRSTLEQFCGHDASILQEIVGVFIDTFTQDTQQLQQALQTQNLSETRFLLHRMKGPLQVMGAKQTLQAMAQFQQQLTDGKIPDTDAQTLQLQFQRILEQVRQLQVATTVNTDLPTA